jgi:hypothetical protein
MESYTIIICFFLNSSLLRAFLKREDKRYGTGSDIVGIVDFQVVSRARCPALFVRPSSRAFNRCQGCREDLRKLNDK